MPNNLRIELFLRIRVNCVIVSYSQYLKGKFCIIFSRVTS